MSHDVEFTSRIETLDRGEGACALLRLPGTIATRDGRSAQFIGEIGEAA